MTPEQRAAAGMRPATDTDLGDGLAVSVWDVGLPAGNATVADQLAADTNRIALIWLGFSAALALAALYQVFWGQSDSGFLSGSALIGAVSLLAGAFFMQSRRRQAGPPATTPGHAGISLRSWWLLLGFAVPLVHVLLTLAFTRDSQVTTCILLLVLGYAIVAPTPESLLHFLTAAVFGWAACQLRGPAGDWAFFILPWIATALLALGMQATFSRNRLVSLMTATPSRRVASDAMINIDAEQRLQSALAAQSDAEKERATALTDARLAQADRDAWARRLEAEHAHWQQQLEQAQRQSAQQQERADEACRQLEVLQKDLTEARRNLLASQHWQAEAAAAGEKIQAAQEESARWQRQSQDAEAEYDALEREFLQLEQQHKELQQQAQQIKQSTGSLEELRDRVGELESQLADKAQSATKTVQTLENLRQEMQALQQAREQLESRLRQAETDRQEAESAWQESEEQLHALQKAKDNAEAEARDVTAEWQRETDMVARLTGVLRQLPQAIALFDNDGGLLLENDAARKLRATMRNLPGEHPLWKLLEVLDAWDSLAESGSWQGEGPLSTASIEENHRILARRLDPADGTSPVVVAAELVSAEVPMAEPVGMAPRFFAGLARTLETPLASLLEHADALLDAATDNEARRQALIGVLRHGRQFRRVLTGAFDYAHLEAGSALITSAPCSPWQLVHQVVGQQRAIAEEKGLDLLVEPAGPIPRSFTSDSDRCFRILRQLVRNALRFSSVGQIIVRLGVEQAPATQPGRASLRIDVDDQGPGLPGQQHDLFEPFGQSTHLGGSGFGLALAHRQAQAIGGKLSAENLPQGGSRFSLRLPLSATEVQDLIPPDQLFIVEEEPHPSQLRDTLQGKVLLALDGPEQQRVVTYHLERLGLRAELCGSGQIALRRAQEEPFPLVLWDWHKTDVTILSAVKQLRHDGFTGAILTIANQITTPQRDSFMLAGGDAILARPIIPAIWRQILASFLPGYQDETLAPNDILRSEFHADREFLALVRWYAQKLPGLVAEMRAALQVADLAQLARQAHATVDSGHLYGYPALAEAARVLEAAVIQGCDSPKLAELLDHLESIMQKIDRGLKLSRSSGFMTLPSPLTMAA